MFLSLLSLLDYYYKPLPLNVIDPNNPSRLLIRIPPITYLFCYECKDEYIREDHKTCPCLIENEQEEVK